MDEVIGTGDAAFIEKAERRLMDFMSRSKILFLASHDETVIPKLCNKPVLMEHGALRGIGEVGEMFSLYKSQLSTQALQVESVVAVP